MTDFPNRSQRNMKIAELVRPGKMEAELPERIVLAGRVIGIIDQEEGRGFILQDDTGRVVIEGGVFPHVGSIIELEVVPSDGGKVVQAGQPVVLADCEEFYISFSSSPNYQKMVIDENLREKLLMRGRVISAVRDFFLARDFLETETPCLVKLPGMEPYLDVFKTRFEADFSEENKASEDMYLITSPEYAMKKLLAGGLEKIFQITKSFRNKETFSERHNPEFTILEWYRAFASYEEIMDDTEALVKYVWNKLGLKKPDGSPALLQWGEYSVDLMAPWKRLKVLDAFRELAGVSETMFFDIDELRKEVKRRGYPCGEQTVFDDLFFIIFMNEIEPQLGKEVPTILYDYPVSMAALSKRCAGDDRFAERFEAYVAGVELCNAFTELNDPAEQERRLNVEKEERRAMGKELYDVDMTFVEALKFGMPPAGGNALGVDRLIMLILGEPDIGNTIFLPYRDL